MTWGQIRFALDIGADGVSLDQIDGYINARYEQLLKAAKWQGIEAHATLLTAAAYQSQADTCTLTVGLATVSGAGTAWTTDLVGLRFYRTGDTALYTVAGVIGAGALILDRPYEGNSAALPGSVLAGSSYVLMQNLYALPADCGSVLSILNPLTGFPLERFSETTLERAAGPRARVGEPGAWALYDDSDGASPPIYHQVEFYPAPLYARGMVVSYISAVAGFDGENTYASPLPWVSSATLLEGCRADIAILLASRAAASGSPGAASAYMALAKGHESKWQEQMATDLRLEFLQRRPLTAMAMAPRFSRHRMARALRGRQGAWRGGTPGGPD